MSTIPKLIYGTCRTMLSTKPESNPNAGPSTENLVESAIKSGVLAFDSAVHEGYNEKELASAINKTSISRNEFWLQSKYSPEVTDVHDSKIDTYSKIMSSIEQSLATLGTDYLDAYIIHAPLVYITSNEDPALVIKKDLEIWEVMTQLYDKGKVNYIGYSHLPLKMLEFITQNSKIQPHFIQNAWPFDVKEEAHLLQYCLENAITYQAFKILDSPLLQTPEVISIAQKYNVSNAQVIIKFAQELGMQVIFGSKNEAHMHENSNLNFNLTLGDVQIISRVTSNPEIFLAIYSKIQGGELTSVINIIDNITTCSNAELAEYFAKISKYIIKLDPSSLAEIIAAKGIEVIDYLQQYNANFSAMNYKHFYLSNIISKQGEEFVTILQNKLGITAEKLVLASLDLEPKYLAQAVAKADLQKLSDNELVDLLVHKAHLALDLLDRNNMSIAKFIVKAQNVEKFSQKFFNELWNFASQYSGNDYWRVYVNAMKAPRDIESEIRVIEKRYQTQVREMVDLDQLKHQELSKLLEDDNLVSNFDELTFEFVKEIKEILANTDYAYLFDESISSFGIAALFPKYGAKAIQLFRGDFSKLSREEIIALLMHEKSVALLKELGVDLKNLEINENYEIEKILEAGVNIEEIIALKKEGANFINKPSLSNLGATIKMDAGLIQYATKGTETISMLQGIGIDMSKLRKDHLYCAIGRTGAELIPALKAAGVNFGQLNNNGCNTLLAIKYGKSIITTLKEVGVPDTDSSIDYMTRDLSSLNEREIFYLTENFCPCTDLKLGDFTKVGINLSKLDFFNLLMNFNFRNEKLVEFKEIGVDLSQIINAENYYKIARYELSDCKEAGVDFSKLNINSLLRDRGFQYNEFYNTYTNSYQKKDLTVDELKLLKDSGINFDILTPTSICKIVAFSREKAISVLKESGIDFGRFARENFLSKKAACYTDGGSVASKTQKIVECFNDQVCYNECIESGTIDFTGCYSNYTNNEQAL